jgi:hypothetical protein
MTYVPTPEDLVTFATDPVAIYAKAHGVSKSAYRDWQEDECNVICSAKTLAGGPCRGVVANGYGVPVKRWLELQGGYCLSHSEGRGGL